MRPWLGPPLGLMRRLDRRLFVRLACLIGRIVRMRPGAHGAHGTIDRHDGLVRGMFGIRDFQTSGAPRRRARMLHSCGMCR